MSGQAGLGSDAARLGVPVRWEYAGQTYHLAPIDLDTELIFQSIHEAFAASRLDAIRSRIGETSFRERLVLQQDAFDANRFAFGGDLSFAFLVSNEGMAELFALLMDRGSREHGGPKLDRAKLLQLARENGPDWNRLWREVMRRDFPTRFSPGALLPPGAPSADAGEIRSIPITVSS